MKWEPVSYGRTDDSDDGIPITIDRMDQRDGSVLWAIRRGRACLNSLGEWEYEPLPSSRDDEFLARCRHPSLERAIAAVEAYEAQERQ